MSELNERREWLILNANNGQFWGPNGGGYFGLWGAGLYMKAEAERLAANKDRCDRVHHISEYRDQIINMRGAFERLSAALIPAPVPAPRATTAAAADCESRSPIEGLLCERERGHHGNHRRHYDPERPDVATWWSDGAAPRAEPVEPEVVPLDDPSVPESLVPVPRAEEAPDEVCQHGVAMDVHCCRCHSGFIFDKDHECPAASAERTDAGLPRYRAAGAGGTVLDKQGDYVWYPDYVSVIARLTAERDESQAGWHEAVELSNAHLKAANAARADATRLREALTDLVTVLGREYKPSRPDAVDDAITTAQSVLAGTADTQEPT